MQPFEETQTLNPLYTIGIFAILVALTVFLWNTYKRQLSRKLLLITAVPYLLITGAIALFLLERLDTRIDETGIHYKYFPGFLKERQIKWSDIYYAELTTFKPWFGEVSRGAMASDRHSNQYVVSGITGLKIKLLDRTVIILGTQRPGDLHKYLQKMADSGVIDKRQIAY